MYKTAPVYELRGKRGICPDICTMRKARNAFLCGSEEMGVLDHIERLVDA